MEILDSNNDNLNSIFFSHGFHNNLHHPIHILQYCFDHHKIHLLAIEDIDNGLFLDLNIGKLNSILLLLHDHSNLHHHIHIHHC